MSKFGIMKDAVFTGEWFLPTEDTKCERSISGTLTWTNGRALLELHDSFTQLHGDIYGDEITTYPSVHGTSTSNDLITVLEASGAGNSISFGRGGMRQRERLHSSMVIVGDHVTSTTTYREMRIRIPGLETWLNRGGIELQLVHPSHSRQSFAICTIENLPPEELSVPAIDANLDFSVNRSFSNITSNNVQVNTYGAVRIDPSSPQTLEWYFEQLSKICTLLGFIAGTPMGPDTVEVKLDGENHQLCVLVGLRQDKTCAIEDAHSFFLLHSALGTDFGEVLSKWFSIYESVQIPSQLAQSVLVSDSLWLHVEFLSLMQALEGFHRATSDGFCLSAEEYEPIKRAILASFPGSLGKSHKSSLKSRIEYGNEKSLSKRLNDLAERLPEELRRRLFGLSGKIPRSWIDTRNYYTHWDETSRVNVLDGAEMHHANVRLRLLLRVLYLDLVGVSSASIARALDGPNKESQYLIQLNNSEIRKAHPNAKVQPLMSINIKDAPPSDGASS